MATRPSPIRASPVLASLARPSFPMPMTLTAVSDPHLVPDADLLFAVDTDGGAS